MYTPDNKTSKNKNQPATSKAAPKAVPTTQLKDMRPEAIIQQKLQKMANASLHQGGVAQLKEKYKDFNITNKQQLIAWIDGEEGWEEAELLAVIRDWNAECDPAERLTFDEVTATNANGFIEASDIAFNPVIKEVQKEEKPIVETTTTAPKLLKKPKDYPIVKQGWGDEKAMEDHCYTYCDKSNVSLLNAAQKLGLPPPMLGHGSNGTLGGTAKDAKLWKQFQDYMEWYFQSNGHQGRSTMDIAKKIAQQ